MPDGDWKIVCHKIDTLTVKVDKMDEKLEKNIEISSDRLRELEKHTALMEKGCVDGRDALRRDVKELKDRSIRNDVISSVAGAITGAGIAIATYLGLKQ